MSPIRIRRVRTVSVLAGVFVAAALSASSALAAEKAVAPEHNPPGDIPDTQVFVTYHSPEGFSLKVPEGWARTDLAHGASFVDKLDGVIATATDAKAAPTIAETKKTIVPAMKRHGRAVKVSKVESAKLPAGSAIRIVYSSNSKPNSVTNKQVRLEDNRYLYYAKGKLVTLDLYAPFGADNVDQWRLMSRSFQWN